MQMEWIPMNKLNPTPQIQEGHSHRANPHSPVGGGLTRRALLTASAAMTGGIATSAFGQATRVRPTPEQVLGPFFPVQLPVDQDADLTVIAGKQGQALGQVLYLSGLVTNLRGEPVADAVLEIWQANAVGRYTHPADDNTAPIDTNFEGYAKIRTGADGSYRIKTVKPGAYPVTPVPGWIRPPHIHFDVKGRASRLMTQMYFEGESLNDKDKYLQGVQRKEALIARYGVPTGQQEKDSLVATWNIVLIAG
jgi:protocatechuate 3,4-dioxygenase beta subunit